MKKKLWIDTDIGGDVDDALALTAALRLTDLEIVGLSTVYLRPGWRAQVAGELMRRAGASPIPIAVGCGRPMSGAWDEARIPDTGVPPEAPLAVCGGHAADLLLEAARKEPELNILAIGPVTNIGMALLKDAEALRACHFYVMGGRLQSALPEWNVLCDPEAMKLLLSSGCDITLVSFDVTRRSQLTQRQVDAFAGSPYRDYLRDMMNAFTRRFGFLPIMHDPMALAMLAAPHFFGFEKRRLDVELRGELTRGTLVDHGAGEGANARVVASVDMPGFMAWLDALLKDTITDMEAR